MPTGAWPRCSKVDVIDWRIAWVSRIGMSGKVEWRLCHGKPIIRTNPYSSRKRDDFECCGNKVMCCLIGKVNRVISFRSVRGDSDGNGERTITLYCGSPKLCIIIPLDK